MTDTRPFLAPMPVVAALALLAGCGGEPSADDGRAASGEVLEGTISDSMLPLDRVRSEAPLEDPEAFAEALEEAGEAPASQADGEGAEAAGGAAADDAEPVGDEPADESEG